MKETRMRLNPENKKSTNKNYIFGNLDGVVDYHHIGDYVVFNDKELKNVLYAHEEHIIKLYKDIEKLKEQHKQELELLKVEIGLKLQEIITSKVV